MGKKVGGGFDFISGRTEYVFSKVYGDFVWNNSSRAVECQQVDGHGV